MSAIRLPLPPGSPLYCRGSEHVVVGVDTVLDVPESLVLGVVLSPTCVVGCGGGGRHVAPEVARLCLAGLANACNGVAHDLERLELEAGIGPGTTRDFPTSLGPCLVTLDELAGEQVGGRGLASELLVNGESRATVTPIGICHRAAEAIVRAAGLAALSTGDVSVLGPVASLSHDDEAAVGSGR